MEKPEKAKRESNPDTVSIEKKMITSALIKALRLRDHRAFETVYLHYRRPLEQFLFSLLRDRGEAEEIAQEVFVKIWEKREGLDPSKNFKTYIYTIARNAVMNLFGHQMVKSKYHNQAIFYEESRDTQEELLIAKETELIIELAVSRMSQMRRAVYELKHYEYLSNGEIAEKLGITKANVANHLSHARKEIKKVIYAFILLFIS